jgi:hypothetical protein
MSNEYGSETLVKAVDRLSLHGNRCKTKSINRSLLRREESEENEINEFLEEFLGCIMSATDPAEPDRKICHHIHKNLRSW